MVKKIDGRTKQELRALPESEVRTIRDSLKYVCTYIKMVEYHHTRLFIHSANHRIIMHSLKVDR
jgi:hypothetical protein